MNCEAVIDFGRAKTNLFINIYNWQGSYPKEIIHLALADITACFHFPRILADVTGAFGYVAEGLYFVSTSHVFGSNISASLWEALWQAIQKMITVLSTNGGLVNKHRELLDLLKWQEAPAEVELVQAFSCKINPGIKEEPGIITLLSANIYFEDILAVAAYKKNMERLLAATIQAIFIVCGKPDISVCQCPLSMEKWLELIVGPKQIVLGLVVDTNNMTVGITEDYIQQVQTLLNLWDQNRKKFQVNKMQKLVGKLACLGEGAPWIFKLMSHLYTSLVFALKSNTELLEKSSSVFRDRVKQITNKTFSGKISDHQPHLNYAMKQAAKMVDKHGQQYLVNATMRDELNFIKKALSLNSGIKF
jgi:hypothetical protein